ncbi:chemotaxis protein CheB, partial [Pseudomonas sp.]|uniref:chemotaxis protein CheB n=1 Tax=Pseudomonas sp. TaxID=306 RepID=UPI00258AEA0B
MPPIKTLPAGKHQTIVALGASAGGLEAMERLLRLMPADSGLCFLVVQHLDPARPSLLSEILGRATSMPVMQAVHGTTVQANTVYVIPPNHDLTLTGRRLVVRPWKAPRGHHLPIDVCFTSLAEQLKGHAIGVVLSGTGADGTLGCRAILDHGGRTLVQLPSEAAYDAMPRHVMEADNASQVLALEQMPAALMGGLSAPGPSDALLRILLHLRQATGHDFTQYKRSTIARRIERRMQVQQIDNQAQYLTLLHGSATESQVLFNELLINV